MITDADKQPDEVYTVRFDRVQSAAASVPVELGCTTLLACGCASQKLLEPCILRIFVEALSCWHHQL